VGCPGENVFPRAIRPSPTVPEISTTFPGGHLDFTLLNTEDTISRLCTLIRDAEQRIVLISPYVDLGAEDRVGRELREALHKRVKVQMIIRADEQTNPKEKWLAEIEPVLSLGLELLGAPALHAKLYYSESTALVTSLNLLRSSFMNTIEAGLWSKEQTAVKAVDQFAKNYVIPHAKPFDINLTRAPLVREKASRTTNSGEGHCIRCGAGILLDPSCPYCLDDFAEWNEWRNEDYVDLFCHGCGKEYPATMRRPVCPGCFRRGI
jgi:phosphatidylserine/phosphatidylglycerophosphate/cardiolipin synthase-like enzyme